MNKNHALFLGRGAFYSVAEDLSSRSYPIYVDVYLADDLKDEPFELVDESHIPVCVLPDGPLLEKVIFNLQAVRARCAESLLSSDQRMPIKLDLYKPLTLLSGI